MTTEYDLSPAGGRRLHVYDTGPTGRDDELVVFWHHGTPNLGDPPAPLLAESAERGIRWISHDRPAYGGSSRLPGRDIASAAADVAAVADAAGVGRFAVMGHSGGGPHALGCAALLPDRVIAAVSVAGLAPFDAAGLDWFDGMAAAGAAELRASVEGRQELVDLLVGSDFDPAIFTAQDHRALAGPWSWLGSVAEAAGAGGIDGMVDDDLAYVRPWGFDPAALLAPVLLMHGTEDRVVPVAHGRWLGAQMGSAEWRPKSGDGHISVLNAGVEALDWLTSQVRA
ncbi:alpha/beta hydrolase [Nakamurella silvestris]|nr:alpha/beta hydrolase [Nakamurella silvestris]